MLQTWQTGRFKLSRLETSRFHPSHLSAVASGHSSAKSGFKRALARMILCLTKSKLGAVHLSDSVNQAQTNLNVIQILNLVKTYCGDSL